MKRDSIDSNSWFIELDRKLRKDICRGRNTRLKFIPKGWLRNFLTDLILHFYRYWLIKPSISSGKKLNTLFICNEYNLNNSAKQIVDKNYGDVPTCDRSKGRIGFAVILTEINMNLLKIFNYRQKWKDRKNLENCDVFFNSSFSSIRVIIQVYLWSLQSYWAIKSIVNSNRYNLMEISGVDCSKVLNPLLEDSFSNQIPRNIIYGLAMVRLADDVLDDGSVVTYGELISDTLFFYALLRLRLPAIKIVAIQHSLIFKNKMQMIMHPEFFISRNGNRLESAPMPDLYLLQGEQAKRIVTQFIPEDRIKIIGSLKSGVYLDQNSAFSVKKSHINILVALSLGDEFYVLDCIQDMFTISNFKWTICFHPAVSSKVKNQLLQIIKERDEFIELYTGKTSDKFGDTDVVISGYSAVGIEALQYGLDTIRIVNSGLPPTIDDDSRIPSVSSFAELSILLKSKSEGEILVTDKDSVVHDFFYIQDNREDERFWDVVNRFNGLQ